ncbi:hypothetical protein [Pseudomonas syringae]|uniref:hypothetical protein n=1 Tax=Pseudomonas syringae TaxID=317 RepID=UPI001F3DE368|nr:hypothetical protein [Pseudomonas syringae]
MSKEWIRKNIQTSVSERLADSVLASYSRHLFYAPLYHPTQSPKEHAEAQLNGHGEEKHAIHSAFHYTDSEVKFFVNKRKKSLTSKYGALTSLTAEK